MNELDPVPAIIEGVVLMASAQVRCIHCKVLEMVLPLDDKPLDDVFIANYLCDECEETEGQ